MISLQFEIGGRYGCRSFGRWDERCRNSEECRLTRQIVDI